MDYGARPEGRINGNTDPVEVMKSTYDYLYYRKDDPLHMIAISQFRDALELFQRYIPEHPDNKKLLKLTDACYVYLINLNYRVNMSVAFTFIDQRKAFRDKYRLYDTFLNIPREVEMGILNKAETIDDVLKKD